MSPEGLNKRFDKKAVEFLKYIFSALWKSKICETSAISSAALTYFQRIRILDATIFQVPKHLAHVYPGSGGCAQTAGIKIQLEYDLHSGQFLNFQIGPGKNNDKTFGTECLDTLRPSDLCIRDLGYFFVRRLRSNGSTRCLLYIQIKIKPYRVCKKSVSRILSKRNRKKAITVYPS